MPDFGIFRGFGSKLFSDKLYAGQLPTQLGLIGSETFGFDTDAQAFFDRVTTAGGSLSATEQTAINTLVIQMKADGIWTKMKAIYPMVGASSAACAQNLKSSSFTGTFNGGITYSSNGVISNGTNGYLNTNLQPSSQLSLNSVHLSYYSRTNPTSNNTSVEIGSWNASYSSGLELGLKRETTNGTYVYLNSAAYTPTTTQNSEAFFIASRTSSSQVKLFRNSSLLSTFTQNSNALPIFNLFILGANNFGSPGNYSNKQCAFASIGDGLTDTESSNFYTAVQAFQTTLGRQV